MFDQILEPDFVRLEVIEPIVVEPKCGIPTILVLSLRSYRSRYSRYLFGPCEVMEREATSGSNRARFETLEENQKKIMAALAKMKATMNQLSLNTAERREHMERRRKHDGERRRDG